MQQQVVDRPGGGPRPAAPRPRSADRPDARPLPRSLAAGEQSRGPPALRGGPRQDRHHPAAADPRDQRDGHGFDKAPSHSSADRQHGSGLPSSAEQEDRPGMDLWATRCSRPNGSTPGLRAGTRAAFSLVVRTAAQITVNPDDPLDLQQVRAALRPSTGPAHGHRAVVRASPGGTVPPLHVTATRPGSHQHVVDSRKLLNSSSTYCSPTSRSRPGLLDARSARGARTSGRDRRCLLQAASRAWPRRSGSPGLSRVTSAGRPRHRGTLSTRGFDFRARCWPRSPRSSSTRSPSRPDCQRAGRRRRAGTSALLDVGD